MFDESVNDAVGIEIVGVVVVVVFAGGVVVVVGIVGVFAVGVGVVVGMFAVGIGVVVGIVGMVVGILVGIVGIDVKIGDGLLIGVDMPIDRRARPSSGSTDSDAFLLDLRRGSRRFLCSWYGFIGFFS
jgi:hypothetical protein